MKIVRADDLVVVSSRWREVALEAEIRRHLEPGARAFQRDLADGHLSVFVARHPVTGWHLSISHRLNIVGPSVPPPGRIPTWDEIKDARYRFVPDDVTMAMLLPPSREFVNMHETTMHLFQVPNDYSAAS